MTDLGIHHSLNTTAGFELLCGRGFVCEGINPAAVPLLIGNGEMGVLVLTYGYRQPPYGQRVAFSSDDGPDGDLGYPSTVELGDGSLFTVCYQKAVANEKCSLLWSRWRLPAC